MVFFHVRLNDSESQFVMNSLNYLIGSLDTPSKIKILIHYFKYQSLPLKEPDNYLIIFFPPTYH